MHRLSPLRPFWILMPLGALYLAIFGRMVSLHAAGPESTGGTDRFMVETFLHAPRGTILDRNGKVLAEDRPVWRLVLDEPPKFRRFLKTKATPESVARELDLIAAAGNLSVDRLEKILLDPKRSYGVVSVAMKPTQVDRLKVVLKNLPGTGLRLQKDWLRVYPQGRTFAHAIGFVKQGKESRFGAFGLESLLESALQGKDGIKEALWVTGRYGVDAANRFVPMKESLGVATTLDVRLGVVMQKELHRIQQLHEPDWSAAVAIEVDTGKLLGVAGLPDFDPNQPGSGLKRDADGALMGLAMPALWAIEPGSTCKPFVVGGALASGAISLEETFSNFGHSWGHRKPPIRNARGVPDHSMTAMEILVWSSNIGAGQIGLRLGADGLQAAFDAFGFWEPLHLTKKEPFLGFKPSKKRWQGAQGRIWTIPSVSMGHQLSLTSMRLVSAFASLVNGGFRVNPHWIGEEVKDERARVLPAEISEFLRHALTGVVEAEHRTWLPRFEDFRWGGKSGTVKKLHEEGYTSLFVGFGPVENPTVAVIVVAENPKGEVNFGSRVAGPAVGEILHQAVLYFGN